MGLREKYNDVLELGKKLKIDAGDWKEEGGKLHLKGVAEYQYEKDQLWDAIKSNNNWEQEVAADIKVKNTDFYDVYTVKSGDSLSKISKKYYRDANRYMDIFNANKDILKDPDLIQPDQKLKIPNP